MDCVRDLWVSSELIDSLYKEKIVEYEISSLELLKNNISINTYIVMRSTSNDKHTALARYLGKNRWKLTTGNHRVGGIYSRDVNQNAFTDSLLDETILVNTAVGSAGTGKTTLALGYACDRHLKDGSRILLCKPTTMVGAGRAFGPVPGDIGEKYAPYLSSFEIVLKKILSDKASVYLKTMREKQDLEFIPLELARGCTYENCTFILDEAQNTSWHELNTLLSRIGENAKIIILGDLEQVDTKCPTEKTGLSVLVNSTPFKNSPITSSIKLLTQYRSPICQLATEINHWVRSKEDDR